MYYDTTFELFDAKQKDPKCLRKLKHLDLMNSHSFYNNYMSFETDMTSNPKTRLKLKSLAVRLNPSRLHDWRVNSNLIDFLHSIASTLKVLRIYRAPVGHPHESFIETNKMTALQELHLWGTITSQLHFLKRTPALKVLHVNLTCFEKRADIVKNIQGSSKYWKVEYEKYDVDMVSGSCQNWMKGVVVPTLTALHFDFAFPPKSLKTLAKWFPNLKVLKTIVKEDTLPLVCELWGQLKELRCLHQSVVHDWNIEGYYRKGPKCKKVAGVRSHLTELEVFQLDCLCDESTLTDASVFNGFLKMTSLKLIQICVSPRFSKEAEKALSRGGFKCRIIRNYAGGDHSNYDCCQRKQFFEEVAAMALRNKEKYDQDDDDDEESDKQSDNELL